MSSATSGRDLFIQQIVKTYPALPLAGVEPMIAPNMISAFQVELPKSVLQQAQDFVAAAFRLRNNINYKNKLAREVSENLTTLNLHEPKNFGICMSYDFHLNAEGHLQLIEVNTNASFLAMTQLMYDSQGVPGPIPSFDMKKLCQCIETEMALTGKSGPKCMAIIDDQPSQQRLFIEFLVYQQLFRQQGWICEVLDFRTPLANYDFIYNRYTDFYLRKDESAGLRDLFNSGKVCLSPNPAEYFYLADKGRMIQWSNADFMADLQMPTPDLALMKLVVPASEALTRENADSLWARRKQFFFKPQQAYGSKQSYKGASVSRRVFEEISGENFIAQAYVPAAEITRESGTGPQNYRYDLRVYAYQDQVQSVVARIYQGQTTNLQTPLGGFACVKFI